MDDYDHLVPGDLKQAAIIVAAFVYNTAQRDEKCRERNYSRLPEINGGFEAGRSLLVVSYWLLKVAIFLTGDCW